MEQPPEQAFVQQLAEQSVLREVPGRGAAQYTPAGQLTQFALRQGRRNRSSKKRSRRVLPLGRLGPGTAATAGLATEGAIEGAAAGLGVPIRRAANDESEMGSMEFIRAAGENIGAGTAFGAGLGGVAGAVLRNPRVAEWLNDWSDASWLRSTGAAIPRARAEAFGGQGAAAVGANTRRYGLVQTGSGADNSLEAIRNRATTLRTEAEMAMGRAANSPAMQYISIPVKTLDNYRPSLVTLAPLLPRQAEMWRG